MNRIIIENMIRRVLKEELEKIVPQDPPAFTIERNPDAQQIWEEFLSGDVSKISRKYQKMILDQGYSGISIGYLKWLTKLAKEEEKKSMVNPNFNSKEYRLKNILTTRDSSGKTKSRKW